MSWDYMIQFLPIICIAFSALIGAFGYWFKLRFERRRTARVVLFHLLEIRRVAVKQSMAPERITESISEKLTEFCRKQGAELPDALRKNYFGPVLQAACAAKTLAMEGADEAEEFQNALHELAADYPVLAHRVRANGKLHAFIKTAMEATGEVTEIARKMMPEGPLADLVAPLTNSIADETVDDFLSELDADIYAVAYQCGWPTRWRTWRLLTGLRKVPRNEVSPAEAKEYEKQLHSFLKESGLGQVLMGVSSGAPTDDRLEKNRVSSSVESHQTTEPGSGKQS